MFGKLGRGPHSLCSSNTCQQKCTQHLFVSRPPAPLRAWHTTHREAPVCCSSSGSSSSSSSSGGSPRQAAMEKQQLLRDLQRAIQSEDYSAAASIKAQLTQLDSQDPITSLKQALDAAVAEERYADAAKLRDQIRQQEELNKPQPPDMEGLTTSSDTVTEGVRVKVRSYYVPAQSRPELNQYFFAYSVSIINEGSRIVMLNSRHWIITDGTGKRDEVRGPGVVGEQPILKPGKSFEYQSACPLYTTRGTMEGSYEMVVLNDQGEWNGRLDVKIGRFALIKPELA